MIWIIVFGNIVIFEVRNRFGIVSWCNGLNNLNEYIFLVKFIFSGLVVCRN